MGRKKRMIGKNNLKMVVGFCIAVIILIAVSFSIKAITIIRQSKFDSEHRFTIAMSNHANTVTEIISLSPETQSLSYLIARNFSISGIQKKLEIPIDGRVVDKNKNEFLKRGELKTLDSKLGKILLRYSTLETNLSILDLARFWFIARTIPVSNRKAGEINNQMPILELDKMSYDLLSDSLIIKEKMSVQIINATDVSGLGNRLARLITNMGGNVVEVLTSDTVLNKSKITYTQEISYTAAKIQKALEFPLEKSAKIGIADIVITIGEDKLNSITF